jgi:hypothetical protein
LAPVNFFYLVNDIEQRFEIDYVSDFVSNFLRVNISCPYILSCLSIRRKNSMIEKDSYSFVSTFFEYDREKNTTLFEEKFNEQVCQKHRGMHRV